MTKIGFSPEVAVLVAVAEAGGLCEELRRHTAARLVCQAHQMLCKAVQGSLRCS